jgi:hypothetical protein
MSKFLTHRIGELPVMLVVFRSRTPEQYGGGFALRDNHDGAIDASQRIALPLPARLADGLGLRSGLGSGRPPPCAPAALLAQLGVWVPHAALRERRTASAAELSTAEKSHSGDAVNRLK